MAAISYLNRKTCKGIAKLQRNKKALQCVLLTAHACCFIAYTHLHCAQHDLSVHVVRDGAHVLALDGQLGVEQRQVVLQLVRSCEQVQDKVWTNVGMRPCEGMGLMCRQQAARWTDGGQRA